MSDEQTLWWFETEPGDMDHMPGYTFDYGVVRATKLEVDAIIEPVNDRHYSIISVRPLDEVIKDLDGFRKISAEQLRQRTAR